MVQKYQNEIAPIFYCGISTKTDEKDLKIPNLQPPDWKSPYWMTLYKEKYQNEISPILYYGISTKINGKDLKIPNLQPPNWKSPYWMTLYYNIIKCEKNKYLKATVST